MRENSKNRTIDSLPQIPDKRYFTIGEASQLCDVKPYVLSYWEQEFPQLNPRKRRGNRRYYQQKDVLMIRRIRDLLYNQGYTISGARTLLTQRSASKYTPQQQAVIKEAISELEEALDVLED